MKRPFILFDLGNVLVRHSYRKLFQYVASLTPGTTLRSKKLKIVQSWFAQDKVSNCYSEYSRGCISTASFIKRIVFMLKADIGFYGTPDLFKKRFSTSFTSIISKNYNLFRNLVQANSDGVGIMSDITPLAYDHIIKKYPRLLKDVDPCHVFLSYRTGLCKADGDESFLSVVRNIKCQAGDVLLVDDIRKNIQNAKKAGCQTILFEKNTDIRRRFIKMGLTV